jgi:hypothetical protein
MDVCLGAMNISSGMATLDDSLVVERLREDVHDDQQENKDVFETEVLEVYG